MCSSRNCCCFIEFFGGGFFSLKGFVGFEVCWVGI